MPWKEVHMQTQNPMQMIQQFNQFRANFKGNPQEEVQKLLASGKLSQAQLNELQKKATEFQNLIQSFNK